MVQPGVIAKRKAGRMPGLQDGRVGGLLFDWQAVHKAEHRVGPR
jgi:hypothetical protein